MFYSSTDEEADAFVQENDIIIHKAGPDQVVQHLSNANTLRQNLVSTWWGLILFVVVVIIVVVVFVLLIISLITSSMFSRIKVLIVFIMTVCVWLFMFYL